MGFLDALFDKSDKSSVLRFSLVHTYSEELERCRKREPLTFRLHPTEADRVLVFHKVGQGSEAPVGDVPVEEVESVADHLRKGFLCEGSIIELKGGE
ncbi:MAG: hypothetical protein V5A14_04050, partial [Desulfohalobiaceae bacterium]